MVKPTSVSLNSPTHRAIENSAFDRILTASGYFSGWPASTLRALVAVSRVVLLGSGGKVVEEGFFGDDFIYVVAGKVQLNAADARDIWRLQRTYFTGDLHRPFGGEGWNCSLWACDSCTLLYIPRPQLLLALQNFPFLARKTLIGERGKSPFTEDIQLPTTQFSSLNQLVAGQLLKWTEPTPPTSQLSSTVRASVRELAGVFGMDALELRIVLSLMEEVGAIESDELNVTITERGKLSEIALGSLCRRS